MSDLGGQNVRQFRARGAGVTRMSGTGDPGLTGRMGDTRPIRRIAAPSTQPFPVPSATETSMSEEHVDDLIAGYALGALDSDERVAVERHAAFCPACARQLAGMRRTATMLPFAVAPAAPSPDVKAALFARIAQSTSPVAAEQAEDVAWARPVAPKPQMTLPASGSWVEPLPTAAAPEGPKRRRSLARMIGVATPVFLTFGLLALFVMPQMLPDDRSDSPEVVELLNSAASECTGPNGPLVTSVGITACGYVQPGRTATGEPSGTLYVSNLRDEAVQTVYSVSVPLDSGSYEVVGDLQIVNGSAGGSGSLEIQPPVGATWGQLCITDVTEDPNLVCRPTLTPAA